MNKFVAAAALAAAFPGIARAQEAAEPTPKMECCEKMKSQEGGCSCCEKMAGQNHEEHSSSREQAAQAPGHNH